MRISSRPRANPSDRAWTPYFVLLVALLATAVTTFSVARSAAARDELRFEHAVQHTRDSIQNRLETYIGMLRGAAGLFAASSSVDRARFRAYVDRLQLPERYAGILGIGCSLRVPRAERAAVVQGMRRDAWPTFRIWPDSPLRPEYHTIVLLEPLNRMNQRAVGYDMFSNPVRRAAMEQARDTGLPAASGKVTLVQEEPEGPRQAGFLIYLPIYQQGLPPGTVAERRRDHVGFVYSPFRADDLLEGIFGSERLPRVHFRIYDGTEVSPEHLLHRSDSPGDPADKAYRPRFTTTTHIQVARRPWTIAFATRPEFEAASGMAVVPLTLAGGLLVSTLLFGISQVQVRARTVAERGAAELKRAEEEVRTLMAGARCLLWHADVEERGGRWLHWKLRIVDEAAAWRFLPVQVPADRTFIEAWYESRLPEDKERMGEYGDGEVRAGRNYSQEYRCRLADGEIRWLAEDVRIETLAPGRWRAIGVCTDITERKQAAAALQEADRRKDEFLAMLAHELRNPLAPIQNAVHLLRLRQPDDPVLERSREVIERQVHHLARLIDDLLDVSRITRGKILLRRTRLDLVRLARETIEDLRDPVESAGLTLAVELPPGPVWIEGDPTRLAQALGNLLHNAAKFTDPGGRIAVRLDLTPRPPSLQGKGEQSAPASDGLPLPCRAGRQGGRSWAVITVRDTGIGISPELLPHLFESFVQADASLDRSRGGLGLGLALVKGLIERHGGEVCAESAGPGQGATFTLSLPVARSPAPPEAEPSPAAVPGGPRRVLVVEDNRDAAETLRELLELSGCTVAVAYSGPAGLEAAAPFRPDVVLCDLGLPGMDGYQVAEALRRDPATASLRLIAVSGYGQEEDRRRSEEAGFDLHLTKPIDFPELQRLLEAPDTARARTAS